MQVGQGSGPAVRGQPPGPVHDVAFQHRPQPRPVRFDQHAPGGVQGVGQPVHHIRGVQDPLGVRRRGAVSGEVAGQLGAGPGHRCRADDRHLLGEGASRAGGRRLQEVGVVETWRVNRLLLADPAVRGLLLAQWLPGVLIVAAEGVVVPYAAGLGRESTTGALLASAAAGTLAGEFLVGRFLPPHRRERLTPWLALLLGVPLLVFVLRPGVVPAAIVLALAAAGFSYHLGLARRFLDALPEAHRGQGFGLAMTGMMTLQGLSMAAAGALAKILAPGTVMALTGVASAAATIGLWPRLRER